jgi:hypothetical protein
MDEWYRVFGRSDALPAPAAIEAHLAGLGLSVRAVFRHEGEQWFQAEITCGYGPPVYVERFLAEEEGVRNELNAWAAYLETCDCPQHVALMERTIQSRQLFTLRQPSEHAEAEEVDRLCVELSRFLAQATDGFYQVDEAGFFAADGAQLATEP